MDRNSPPTNTRPAMYRCPVCEKCYDRLDKIKRHLGSHENARKHSCLHCPRKFNRKDLLDRHQLTHQSGSELRSLKRRRALRACQSCVMSKTRCDDARPCQRCKRRGFPCESGPGENLQEDGHYALLSPKQAASSPGSSNSENSQISPTGYDRMDSQRNSICEKVAMGPVQTEQPTFIHAGGNLLAEIDDTLSGDLWPDHFHDYSPFQPDVTLATNNAEMHLDQSTTFQYLVPFDMGEIFPLLEEGKDRTSADSLVRNSTINMLIDTTSEALKRSVWNWVPQAEENSFSNDAEMNCRNERAISGSEATKKVEYGLPGPVPFIRENSTRDRLYSIILKHSEPWLDLSKFPSLNVLQVPMQSYFAMELENPFACIHQASFDPDQSLPELVLAVIAAGAVTNPIASLQRLGHALHDKTRMAIVAAMDKDSSLIRNLQMSQTLLHWIELAMTSGCRRKMEIAEALSNNTITIVRRAGATNTTFYARIPQPLQSDHGEQLRAKWLVWAEMESFKRLVLRALVGDIQSSITFIRPPSFSLTEIAISLPASKELWQAQGEVEWRNLYQQRPITRNLTFQDISADIGMLVCQGSVYDVQLCALAVLYAQWIRIWSLSDARAFHLRNKTTPKRTHCLLSLDAQQKDMYETLKQIREQLVDLDAFPAEAEIVFEFLMMSIHVSLREIQCLSGRFGPEEANNSLRTMEDWFGGDTRNHAVWHAGQVLRASQSAPSSKLHVTHSILIYHACLTLWVTALSESSPVVSLSASSSVNQSTNASSSMLDSAPLVILNGKETTEVKRYLQTGQGTLALKIAGEVGLISNCSVISDAMSYIFGKNDMAAVPPLIEKLIALMRELSRPLSNLVV